MYRVALPSLLLLLPLSALSDVLRWNEGIPLTAVAHIITAVGTPGVR